MYTIWTQGFNFLEKWVSFIDKYNPQTVCKDAYSEMQKLTMSVKQWPPNNLNVNLFCHAHVSGGKIDCVLTINSKSWNHHYSISIILCLIKPNPACSICKIEEKQHRTKIDLELSFNFFFKTFDSTMITLQKHQTNYVQQHALN